MSRNNGETIVRKWSCAAAFKMYEIQKLLALKNWRGHNGVILVSVLNTIQDEIMEQRNSIWNK